MRINSALLFLCGTFLLLVSFCAAQYQTPCASPIPSSEWEKEFSRLVDLYKSENKSAQGGNLTAAFDIFPNPTAGMVTFGSGTADMRSIRVIDVTGRIVFEAGQ